MVHLRLFATTLAIVVAAVVGQGDVEWHALDIQQLVCPADTGAESTSLTGQPYSFSLTYENVVQSQPQVLTIIRQSSAAMSIRFNITEADGTLVIPSTTVELASLGRRLDLFGNGGAIVDTFDTFHNQALESEHEAGADLSKPQTFLWQSSSRRLQDARRRATPTPAPTPDARRRVTPSPTPTPSPSPTPSPTPTADARRRVASSPTPTPTPTPSPTPTASARRRETPTPTPSPPPAPSVRRRGSTAVARPTTGTSSVARRRTPPSPTSSPTSSPTPSPLPLQTVSYGTVNTAAYASGYSRTQIAMAVGGGLVAGAVVGVGALALWNALDNIEGSGGSGSEAKTRLQSAGARSGDITISLLWNNTNDVDLYVQPPPTSNEIYYGNRQSSGGWLDVDQNVDHDRTDPVENVVFESAPLGRYTISAKLFSTGSGAATTTFTVILRSASTLSGATYPDGATVHTLDEGTIISFTGTLSEVSERMEAFSFTVTDQPARQWCLPPASAAQPRIFDCSQCERQFGSPCASATACMAAGNCAFVLPSAVNRDYLTALTIDPSQHAAPLVVTVESLSGSEFQASQLCGADPQAASVVFVTLTAQDVATAATASAEAAAASAAASATAVCDTFTGFACNAGGVTGACYDNEMCQNSLCACEAGACLNDLDICDWSLTGTASLAFRASFLPLITALCGLGAIVSLD